MGDSWIQPCGLPGVPDSNCFSSPVGDSGGYIASLIRMHPHDPNKLFALVARKTCVDEDEVGYEVSFVRGRGDLMYSPDFGRTWQNLRENSAERVAGFVDFDCPRGTAPPRRARHPRHGVRGPVARRSRSAQGVGLQRSLLSSPRILKSPHERRLTCGNPFEVPAGGAHVAQLSDCEASHGASKEDKDAVRRDGRRASRLHRRRSQLKRACFPVGLRQRGFTIFDWNEGRDGADFIAVDHDEEDAAEAAAPMGNVHARTRRDSYLRSPCDATCTSAVRGLPSTSRVSRGCTTRSPNDAFVSPEGRAACPRISSRRGISFNAAARGNR